MELVSTFLNNPYNSSSYHFFTLFQNQHLQHCTGAGWLKHHLAKEESHGGTSQWSCGQPQEFCDSSYKYWRGLRAGKSSLSNITSEKIYPISNGCCGFFSNCTKNYKLIKKLSDSVFRWQLL